MSLASKLGQIGIDALPKVIELVDEIAESGDQLGAAEKALLALRADAADAARDAAVEAALKAGKS